MTELVRDRVRTRAGGNEAAVAIIPTEPQDREMRLTGWGVDKLAIELVDRGRAGAHRYTGRL